MIQEMYIWESVWHLSDHYMDYYSEANIQKSAQIIKLLQPSNCAEI